MDYENGQVLMRFDLEPYSEKILSFENALIAKLRVFVNLSRSWPRD
jgi:hypothetical protein